MAHAVSGGTYPAIPRITEDDAGLSATSTFGADVYCRRTLRTGRLATGLELVAQNVLHRLITAPGELRYAPEYGLGIEDLVGEMGDNAAGLEQRIKTELLQDPRVQHVEASVTPTVNGAATYLVIEISCATGAGPFDLVLKIADATVENVAIRFPEAA